jgi:hypothetical protein
VRLSKIQFDPGLPYWQDYLPFMQGLKGQDFPGCDQLNALLPEGLCSGSGSGIRFVPSHLLPDEPYEHRIYTSGQVSTRAESWHDLFNALVWMRFPRIKVAMNTLHFNALSEQKAGSRGQLRDALTLFDECGVIVFSSNREILNALAERRWSDAFLADAFKKEVRLSITGHAMLEKYLSPYKSMTAKALLIVTGPDFQNLSRQEMLDILDSNIAKRMLGGELLTRPANMTPLPLAGVPGWWPQNEQSKDSFYDDLHVFRPASVKVNQNCISRLD